MEWDSTPSLNTPLLLPLGILVNGIKMWLELLIDLCDVWFNLEAYYVAARGLSGVF